MRTIYLTPLVLLISLSTWVKCEPPAPNYVHSSYDDQSFHYEEPHSLSHSHGHGHGHGHGHSHSHGHGSPAYSPSEEPEIIVQHHHHGGPPGPTRTVQHAGFSSHGESGTIHYPAPTTSSSGYKPSSHRHTPSFVTRGHGPSHGHSHSHGHGHSHSHAHGPPPGHGGHYHSSPVKTAYSSHPTKNDHHGHGDSASLTKGYASYMQNDYKAYSAPSSYSDDYGIEAYSPGHASDYGTSSNYHNGPAHKEMSLAYNSAPGSSYSGPVSHSVGYSSYGTVYEEPAPTSAPTVYTSRPKSKGYRTPSSSSYSSYAAPPTNTYGLGSKPSSPYSTVTHSKGYGAPKGGSSYLPKLLSAYASSKSQYGPTKGSYSAHKTPYSGSLKTYYRQPSSSKGYTSGYAPTSTSYSTGTTYGSSTGALGSPSYSYGSPAAKGFGYSYNSQYDKPVAEKGYVRFTADDTHGGHGEHATQDEISETYGGGFDAGTSHY